MAYGFSAADVGFLTTAAGRAALEAFVPSGDRLADVAVARRRVGDEHAAEWRALAECSVDQIAAVGVVLRVHVHFAREWPSTA